MKDAKVKISMDGTVRWIVDRMIDGLMRKATCRRLAQAGCCAHEIMAISGH